MERKKRTTTLNILLVLGSSLITLFAAELIFRDYSLGFQNMILLKGGGNLVEHHFRGLYSYDARLGWVPAPNKKERRWGTTVTTLDDGIRSNGTNAPVNNGLVIMTVGGSFTFGDEVADGETWPAYLEKMTGARVINAGVSSYGLDQSILRAEQLVPKYNPDVVIVSMIFDSFSRCQQYVRHGVPKPYFTYLGDQLTLNNTPVPFKKDVQLDWFRQVFGYSHLVHRLMDSYFPAYWLQDTMHDFRSVKGGVYHLVPLLFQRLINKVSKDTQIIVLVHDTVNVSDTRHVVLNTMVRDLKTKVKQVKVCDLVPRLIDLKKMDKTRFESLYLPPPSKRHSSPKGNAFIATMLKKQIFNQGS